MDGICLFEVVRMHLENDYFELNSSGWGAITENTHSIVDPDGSSLFTIQHGASGNLDRVSVTSLRIKSLDVDYLPILYSSSEGDSKKTVGYILTRDCLAENFTDNFTDRERYLKLYINSTISFLLNKPFPHDIYSQSWHGSAEVGLNKFYQDDVVFLALSNELGWFDNGCRKKVSAWCRLRYCNTNASASGLPAQNRSPSSSECNVSKIRVPDFSFSGVYHKHKNNYMNLIAKSRIGDHQYLRFILLYQVIELLMDLVYSHKIKIVLDELKDSDSADSRHRAIKKVTAFNEKSRIADIPKHTKFENLFTLEQQTLHDRCKEWLEKLKDSSESPHADGSWHTSLYAIRNILIHNGYTVSDDLLDGLSKVNDAFDSFLCRLLPVFGPQEGQVPNVV